MQTRLALALGTLLLAAPTAHTQDQDERPPLGRHLRDVSDVAEAAGVAVDDDGGLWVLERHAGRLLRIEADGARRVLTEGLADPRAVEVDADGSLWVTEALGRGVVHLDAEGALLGSFGGELLHRAHGLGLAGERVVVTDRGRHRVEVFDVEGEHLFGFGGHGTGEAGLIRPEDVAVDEEGRFFVADAGNSRVQVFDADGAPLARWGDWGPFPGLFHEPSGVVLYGGRLFVSDRGNHRVQVFSPEGELVDRFGLHAIRPREGGGFLHYPVALALSPDGELAALSEPMVDRVQLFCRTGGTAEDEVRRQAQALARPSAHYGWELELSGPYLAASEPESHSVLFFENTGDEPRRIARVGALGTKTGLLTGVGGVHFEREMRDLWVCDPLLRRLSLFRLRGSEEDEVGYDPLMARFVKSLDLARLFELELRERLEDVPEPVALDRDGAGRFHVGDRRNGCVLVLSPALEVEEVLGLGHLVEPTAVEVSGDGQELYVVDRAVGLVVFRGEERAVRVLAASGPDGPLVAPHDLARSADGSLYVTDGARHRVFVFGPEGEARGSWGGEGLGRGEFYKPRGIDLDDRGRLTVVDHANHRLQTFDREGNYVGIFGPRLYTKAARYPDLPAEQE